MGLSPISLLLFCFLPTLLLIFYLSKRQGELTSPRVVLTTFVLGMVCSIPVYFVSEPALRAIVQLSRPFVVGSAVSVLAAVLEECAKFSVVVFYSARRKEFRGPSAGILYGAAASLGFATAENVLYVLNKGFLVGVVRVVISLPLQAALGAIMGYFVATARQAEVPVVLRVRAIKGLALAMLLHGLFDFPIFTLLVGVNSKPDNFGSADMSVFHLPITLVFLFLLPICVLFFALVCALRLADCTQNKHDLYSFGQKTRTKDKLFDNPALALGCQASRSSPESAPDAKSVHLLPPTAETPLTLN